MSEPQGVKRARSNTIGDIHINTTAPPPEEISQRIQQLDLQTVTNILTQAAQIHPDVMSMVNDAIRVIREKEQDPILTFDCHLSSLRHMIKIISRSISSGAEYDVSFEVACVITDTIQSIAEECGPFTNPQTRFNGLSAMLNIGKNIALLSKDTLGHEVRMQFDSDPSLAEGMLEILNSMTEDEIREIRGDELSPGSLWLKLQELEKLSDDLGIHPGLDEVLKQVDSDGCEDEEELDEEEDEDENEEELDEEENEDEEN